MTAVPPPDPTLSHDLLALARNGTSERITVQDLLDGLQTRARAALLILFAIPNTLPGIPGTSAVTGLPLVFLTLQMLLGRPVWLPGVIANRSLRRTDLETVITRATPWLQRIERVLRPRLQLLSTAMALRGLGGICALLSLIIMLPVPFGNMLPALAILAIGFGMLERDGLFILIGLTLAALSLALLATIYWLLIKAAIFVLVGALAS